MQCEYNSDMREGMFADIMENTGLDICEAFKYDTLEMLYILLGKPTAKQIDVDLYHL